MTAQEHRETAEFFAVIADNNLRQISEARLTHTSSDRALQLEATRAVIELAAVHVQLCLAAAALDVPYPFDPPTATSAAS